jgi:hypothetical protein
MLFKDYLELYIAVQDACSGQCDLEDFNKVCRFSPAKRQLLCCCVGSAVNTQRCLWCLCVVCVCVQLCAVCTVCADPSSLPACDERSEGESAKFRKQEGCGVWKGTDARLVI